MQGNINPLAQALIDQEKTKAQQEINKQFPYSSAHDIKLALDGGDDVAATHIADEESRRQLVQQQALKNKLASGFTKIHLGNDDKSNEEPGCLKGKCFWVPASVRHEVRKDDITGFSRYSFFVYGGVNIQPRINIVASDNGPLNGNRVGAQGLSQANVVPSGSIGAMRSWTIKARMNAAELPNEGRVRFVPEHRYHASEPFLRGPNNGYLDRFRNEWIKGASRTPGQAFEWDVQLSDKGKKQFGWASRDGRHLNVSLDGKITHK